MFSFSKIENNLFEKKFRAFEFEFTFEFWAVRMIFFPHCSESVIHLNVGKLQYIHFEPVVAFWVAMGFLLVYALKTI
jgi:hypothetical protein